MSIYRGRNRKEFYLASLLYDSIEDRDISAVNSLLSEKKADPNLVLPKQGISPFHLAIGCDSNDYSVNVTTLILQNGGDPNVRSDDGLTPLHIAAAWGRIEILKLLLNSGGDPEIRDINNKTALHYAHEEKFVECLNLLKSYLPIKSDLLKKEKEDCNAFNIILDKILVNNGTTIGEYKVVNEHKTDIINKKDDLPNLPLLPQSDTTEYVINWFNKHVQNGQRENIPYRTPPKSSTSSIDGIDSFESSVDESNDEITRPINAEFITFRKAYTKTRKVSKDNSTASKSPTNVEITPKAKTKSNDSSYAEDFTKLEEFSKESGIVTLPSSTKLSTLFDDSNAILHPLDDTILFTESASQTDLSKSFKNDSILVVDKELAKDTSSDYMTCSSNNLSHFLEKNVFEMTEDLSGNLCPANESKSIKSFLSNNAKSEGIGSDASIVSISEVYKYVDKDEGIVLFEKRILKSPTSSDYSGSLKSSSFSSKLSSLPETIDYDTDTLRKELTLHGYTAGPITVTTKRVYLKKLHQLKQQPIIIPKERDGPTKKVYSVELEKTLRDANWYNDIAVYKALEEVVIKQFSNPDPTRKWREGVNKSSFTYLLLDPRVTYNLPCRAELLQPKEVWEIFLSSIFYVGKGKRARPYNHLYEAVRLWNQEKYTSTNKKLQHILDIWKNNKGVICLHVFQNTIPVEAFTREGAMISALKIENVSNVKAGEFYGLAATWPQKQKKMLGVYLLYKAMMIFLNEGERQLCPSDID